MNNENCGQKDKRKIVVEFEIPERFSHYKKEDFKIKLNGIAFFLKEDWEISSELLESAKIVSFSDSKNYDTIP